MEYVQMAASVALSRVAFGTWRLWERRPTDQEANRLLGECLDAGITTVDTAEIYGRYEVEDLLGRAMAPSPGLRDRLEIVTKCGIEVPCPRRPGARVAHYNATAAHLGRVVDGALMRLRTDRVEMFLVHRPDWLTLRTTRPQRWGR